jgi:ankyrin repeat protein
VGKEDVTPLFWVMTSRSTTGMKQLLNVGADLNAKMTRRRVSAVNLAAGADDPKFLKVLLEHGGGDLDLADVDGNSPLQIAARENRLENVKLLLKYGADIHLIGGIIGSSTAAETAVSLNRYAIAVYMLEQGYNHDLQYLARLSEGSIDPDSEHYQWKLKLHEMLKQRGVKFPAHVPTKKKRKYPSVHDRK